MIPAAMDALVQFSGSLRANVCGIINDNAPKLVAAGLQLIVQLAVGLIQAIPVLIENIPQIIQAVVAVFTAFNWASLGRSAITAIRDGVKSLATSLPAAFKSICSKAKSAIKSVDWKALGMGTIRAIVAGVRALATAIPKTLRSIGKTAWKWMKDVDWKGLGIKVIKGIIGGITGMGKSAWKAVKGIFTGKGKGDEVDMDDTGREAVQSYAGAVSRSAPEVSGAVSSISGDAFRGAAMTEAAAAGHRAGGTFAEAVDIGASTADVDMSKAVDRSGTEASMRAAGRSGARAARSGMQAGIAASKVSLGRVSLDTRALDRSMRSTGRKGIEALGSEVKKGSRKVTVSIAQLGREIVTRMSSTWGKVRADADKEMADLVSTLTRAAQSAVNAIRAAFEGMTIRIPAPRIPEIRVTSSTVSYGSGRDRATVEVPRFSTVWHAIGGIFKRPTIFGTASGSHGVGESGPEAILPLDLLWKKMGDIMDGQGPSSIEALADRLSGISGSADGAGLQRAQPSMAAAGGDGGFRIEYSPTYNLYGSASGPEVEQADKMGRREFQKEFSRAMKQWEKEQARRRFNR